MLLREEVQGKGADANLVHVWSDATRFPWLLRTQLSALPNEFVPLWHWPLLIALFMTWSYPYDLATMSPKLSWSFLTEGGKIGSLCSDWLSWQPRVQSTCGDVTCKISREPAGNHIVNWNFWSLFRTGENVMSANQVHHTTRCSIHGYYSAVDLSTFIKVTLLITC